MVPVTLKSMLSPELAASMASRKVHSVLSQTPVPGSFRELTVRSAAWTFGANDASNTKAEAKASSSQIRIELGTGRIFGNIIALT